MMELRKVFLIVPRKLEVHSSNSSDSQHIVPAIRSGGGETKLAAASKLGLAIIPQPQPAAGKLF